MKVTKISIKARDFREFKVKNNLLKYFKTMSPFESQTEVHLHFNDVYIVLEGNAVVQVSKNYSGGKEITEGEIRDCQMKFYDTIKIQKDDIVLIPAGTAHKLIVESDAFEQIILKIPK